MLSLIHAVAGRPWAIRADIAFHIRGLLAREGIAGLRHLAALKAEVHEFDAARPQSSTQRSDSAGTVGVVPVVGTLTQRVRAIGSAETRSTAEIADQVRAYAMDPNVDAVLLEIDSPGGEVFGVPEAWASIRASASLKPILAHANSVAASAALYLGSAADEFWVTPSGEVGSVGVYALHVDMSKALAEMGEAWDFIVAQKSPYKIEGNPAGPLTDEARAHAQKDVDRYMGMFIRDLAKGRRVSEKQVEQRFGGGRMLSPAEAVSAGMVDQIGTFDQVVRRAGQLVEQRRGIPRRKAAAVDPLEIAMRAALAGIELEEIK
jgi:signal peptide peptidase SppA